jgi:dihydroorotate dehydrogenase electron transfer subunit
MSKEILTTTLYNKEVARDIFEIKLKGESGLKFIPGQFAHIAINQSDLLLRRPLSINSYDEKSGEFVFIYIVVGFGTQVLKTAQKGELISILAPLGVGFKVLKNYKKIFLVGGGIGCAPLESIIDAFPKREYYSFLGYDCDKSIYHFDEFEAKSKQLYITTVDGSIGHEGIVTAPLKQELEKSIPDVIFACGPTPMLKALKETLEPYNIKTYISVEERMGCGMGGCAVCACNTINGNKKACIDGPVFDLSEVIF